MRATKIGWIALQDFPAMADLLTVPFKRPIKPVYIRKLVAFIDEVKRHDGEA